MSRNTQNLTPLRTVVIDGYVIEDRLGDGTHCNLPRESDLNFSATLKALRAMLYLHGGATRSTASDH